MLATFCEIVHLPLGHLMTGNGHGRRVAVYWFIPLPNENRYLQNLGIAWHRGASPSPPLGEAGRGEGGACHARTCRLPSAIGIKPLAGPLPTPAATLRKPPKCNPGVDFKVLYQIGIYSAVVGRVTPCAPSALDPEAARAEGTPYLRLYQRSLRNGITHELAMEKNGASAGSWI